MTTSQIWKEVTSKPKWYADIRNNRGNYYNAQTANGLKSLFKKGKLKISTIEYIFLHFGYVKEEIKWVKK